MEGRGQALGAAGPRCAAPMTPSGGGRRPGEQREHGASGAALTLSQMSSPTPAMLYKIRHVRHTRQAADVSSQEEAQQIFAPRNSSCALF